MKKSCLSEEIFEVVSNEESHYKRRSFDGKAREYFGMTKTPNYASHPENEVIPLFEERDRG